MKDYYQILEVEPDASQEQIKSQYRFLVQGFHPDKYASAESKAKAEEKLKQINEAFSVLKDRSKREQYDQERLYAQKMYDDQAQNQRERKQREYEVKAQREAKEKAERERAKRAEEEQAARAKAQREAEERSKSRSAFVKQPPISDRKPAIDTSTVKSSPFALWQIAALIVLCSFVLFLGWLGARAFSVFTPVSPTMTEITLQIPTATTDVLFSATETPRPTATEIPFAVEDGLSAASEAKMVLIPEGEFIMGSDDKEANDDAKPLHKVTLSSFYIDQYEVTNVAYKRCVDVGVCSPPTQSYSLGQPARSAYYGNPEFNDYPVMYVNWNMANTYCSWRDARLPTEAEWEKAARGTNGYIYPWGNASVDCSLANYFAQTGKTCAGDTTKVGSYENGKSPYGVYDMIGNVYELVNDWYSETYYQNSSSVNPLGPDSGNLRVLRGGSAGITYNAHSMFRNRVETNYAFAFIGFRCASSP